MEIRGIGVNRKSVTIFLMHFLIFADILFITVGVLLDLHPDVELFILRFDLFICLILLSEWLIKSYVPSQKRNF